ncbi:hypothetical protein IscW_ISCW018305 [Ixodes scapularis]|uniref:Uncharacterized protein n=1 Tax=Ixodes scapularis TaxID=6945 RepID=B7PGT4_IXOSC|nr:hypothetical protein IscW_ISCW018305 [Ixodes scapularis]|eukprot:XP_002401443.1 hypothetical protein IscW_ISCW018305 [Ixodes scapularis]
MLVQRQNNSTEPLESVNNVTTQEVPIHLDSGWNSTSLAYVFVPLGLVVCLGLAAALNPEFHEPPKLAFRSVL